VYRDAGARHARAHAQFHTAAGGHGPECADRSIERASAGAQPNTGLNIEVHIDNYSAISAERLARAVQQAARIFENCHPTMVCPTAQEEVRNEAAGPQTRSRR